MEIWQSSAEAIHKQFMTGEVSAVSIVEAFLNQIDSYDKVVQSVLTVDREAAMAVAHDLDRRIGRGMDKKIGALAGVPILVKDTICTKGLRTTAASKILENFIPPYDATVVHRLKLAGAILLGKTNMDEFAMGSSTENSAFQKTRNPWDIECTPGGSSGGTAAAIAARMAPLGLGSDTGGSIRQPASLCGIVGLKPTYGRVSRYGLIAFASSFDQIGPMTHTVRDAAMMLSVIAGRCMTDLTTLQERAPDFLDGIEEPVKGLKVGIPREYLNDSLDLELRKTFETALDVMREELGVQTVDVSLPHTKYGIPAYYIVATAEASSNLSRYDGVHYGHRTDAPESLDEMYSDSRAEGFGDEVKRRIMLGTFALSSGYHEAYYDKALRVRRLVKEDFDAAFETVDLIVAPTSPTPAFPLGEKIEDPLKMYMCDALTVPANLAGIPGISLNCGFTGSGLPVGLQILGKHFDEKTLLRLARNYEKVQPFNGRIPTLIGGESL